MTTAETCRKKGWREGDVLRFENMLLQILVIGVVGSVLSRACLCGDPDWTVTGTWELHSQAWKKIAHAAKGDDPPRREWMSGIV